MLTPTIETVLQGYVVAIASSNHWLRQQMQNVALTTDNMKNMVEEAIKKDIESAKEQIPTFLKEQLGTITADYENELKTLHITSFISAFKADAAKAEQKISEFFSAPDNVVQMPAPPPPPPVPAETAAYVEAASIPDDEPAQ